MITNSTLHENHRRGGMKRPPLSRILPDSCEKLGGFGDGHTVAASGVFPIGREEAFLEELDALAGTAAS